MSNDSYQPISANSWFFSWIKICGVQISEFVYKDRPSIINWFYLEGRIPVQAPKT